MSGSFSRHMAWMALYFVIVNVIGIWGYMFFEGWSFHDALYMTVITLTAVGYHEVAPLSAAGRNFTMGLLALGLTGLGLWFAAITAFFVEMDLTGTLQRRRTMKTIAKLRNHVIVCGCGRTGMQVLIELEQSELDFVVVEVDAERIRSVRSRFPNALVVEGDAAKDEALESAGIRHARGLITCLSEDADNLFVCLSARVLNAELTVVARADDPETTAKMYRAGASHVVSPNVSGGVTMAAMLVRPSATTLLEIGNRLQKLNLRTDQVALSARAAAAGKTLDATHIRESMVVVALLRGADQKQITFNPKGSTTLKVGDELVVMGTPRQLQQLGRWT
ncbi:MAG: potassium channel protein [Gammaproteobacteria bacterium]|nr:potassium channel protein [Gammaproteobacteria bacterium]